MIAAVRAFRCFVLKLQKVFYLQTSCQGYDWLQLTASQSRKNWGLQNITIYCQVSHITMKWEKPLILLTAIIQLHKLHQSSWFKSADESLSSLANIAHVTLFKLHVAFAAASHFATNLPSVPLTLSLSYLSSLMPALFFLCLLLSWCFCLSAWTLTKVFLRELKSGR